MGKLSDGEREIATVDAVTKPSAVLGFRTSGLAIAGGGKLNGVGPGGGPDGGDDVDSLSGTSESNILSLLSTAWEPWSDCTP